ncbi:MAG: hypothetical protein AAF467_10360 [Actinomycetota bacterium]
MNGTVWIMSYVLLWATVGLLSFAVVALLRQVGVLHTRVAPMGVHFAGEGPALDEPAPAVPDVDYAANAVTLVAFTTADCEICGRLKPGLERLDASYDEVALHVVDHGRDAEVFGRFTVRSTPYLVAVDRDGVVRSRGVANSLDQVEEMLAEVLAGPPVDAPAEVADSAASAEIADIETIDVDTLLADLDLLGADGQTADLPGLDQGREQIDADALLAELADADADPEYRIEGEGPGQAIEFLSEAEADDLLALDLTGSIVNEIQLDLPSEAGRDIELDADVDAAPDSADSPDAADADPRARFVVNPDGVTVDVSGPQTELVVEGDPMVEGFSVIDVVPDPLVVDPLEAYSTPHSVAAAGGPGGRDQSDDDLATDLRVHLTEALRS